MMCSSEMTEEQLRLALAAIEKAKERGFSHTTAIVHLSSVNSDGKKMMTFFSDAVILKAHTTDPNQDWGLARTWSIDWYKCVDGNLVTVD